jgi:hypothetical protein
MKTPEQIEEEKKRKEEYRIAFDGGACVTIMGCSTSCHLTLEEIIKKDLPKGTRYKIIPVSEVPTDRTFRNAWTYLDEDSLVNE